MIQEWTCSECPTVSGERTKGFMSCKPAQGETEETELKKSSVFSVASLLGTHQDTDHPTHILEPSEKRARLSQFNPEVAA